MVLKKIEGKNNLQSLFTQIKIGMLTNQMKVLRKGKLEVKLMVRQT